MVARRQLLGGLLIAGLVGAAVASKPMDAWSADGPPDIYTGSAEVVAAVQALRNELRTERLTLLLASSPHIDQVRAQQRAFLKTHQKYPDFIEVGLDVWDSAHDWHIRHLQPLGISRLADGRYGMTFGLSTLVLRTEALANLVGIPYDAK